MKISEIMTRRVVSARPETTIAEAARLMLRHRISGLPVVEDETLVGIVSEGDLLRRSETGTVRQRPRWLELLVGPGRLAGDYINSHARKVGEVMTQDVVAVRPYDEVAEAVRQMELHHVKRLPVVEDDRLIGIVSRANLVRALLHRLSHAPEDPRVAVDSAIRDRILAEIDKEPWGPRFGISVKVTDGLVEFFGSISDDRERGALRVLAENVPGVKDVRDHLVWVEPISGIVIGADATTPPANAA